MTVPQAQDQFLLLKRFVNNWPLYDIVSRFLRNHSRYVQTKLSGLDVTQGGSVDSEVDKGDAGNAPSDPQGEEQNDMNVEEGEQHEEENEMDVEEDNGMDAEDGEHDSQTDENTIGPQVPALEKRAPKKGSRPDPDSQAVGVPHNLARLICRLLLNLALARLHPPPKRSRRVRRKSDCAWTQIHRQWGVPHNLARLICCLLLNPALVRLHPPPKRSRRVRRKSDRTQTQIHRQWGVPRNLARPICCLLLNLA